MVIVAVRGALDRRGVIPRDRLRVAGRTRGKKNVNPVAGQAGPRLEVGFATEKVAPSQVADSQPRRDGRRLRPVQNDGSRGPGQENLLIQRQGSAAAAHVMRGEHRLRPGYLQTPADLRRREALRDRDGHTAGLDDAEVNGHTFDPHVHHDGDRVPGNEPMPHEAVGYAIGQSMQLAVSHPGEWIRPGAVHDRRGVFGRLKAALADIELCPR